MGKKSEQGNVLEIVIIVVLVLTVIGLLVWRFLDSQQLSTDQQAYQDQSQSQETATTKSLNDSINQEFGVALTFEYPGTWTLSRELDGSFSVDDTVNELVRIASPSGQVVVTYHTLKGGGLGGYCAPEESPTIASYSHERLASFSGTSYLEYTTTLTGASAEGLPVWGMGLYRSSAVGQIGVGSSVCDIYLTDALLLGEQDSEPVLFAGVDIIDADTVDKFKTAAVGEEYKQARDILLSTKH